MPKILLTDLSLKSLRVPAAGQITYWDRRLSGFNIRVSQGGTKTFCVTHGPDRQRITIGRYPLVPLAAARKRAREILLSASLNPNKRPSLPFSDARQRYLSARKSEVRLSTYNEIVRHFEAHFSWKKNVDAINVRDVTEALDAITAPSRARHTN